jgi:hypothetical protein
VVLLASMMESESEARALLKHAWRGRGGREMSMSTRVEGERQVLLWELRALRKRERAKRGVGREVSASLRGGRWRERWRDAVVIL